MPLKVAMLPGSVSRLAGGLFTSVRRLSESLSSNDDFEVTVIGNRDEYTDLDSASWNSSPIVLESQGRLRCAMELTRELQVLKPDLIHTHFIWSYASLATLRSQRCNVNQKHIVSPRGMLDPWAVRNSSWKKRLAAALFETKHLERAACIHALSENEAKSIREFGLNNPICVVPNGIDVPTIHSLEALNSSQNPSGERKTMLFVGRIHPKKGIAGLIKAWAIARVRLKDWRLVIAGWADGQHIYSLKELVEELNLDKCVSFIGPIMGQQKTEALLSADAFILPSFSEGLPMAVLEAWSHRLPVLMTTYCNIPEGFVNRAAIEIPTDEQELAQVLSQFSETSDDERQLMGARGRKLVEDRFDWKLVARQLSDVYRWIDGKTIRPDCVQLR